MKAFRLILTGFTLIFLCWVSVFAQNPDRFTVDPNQTWQGTGVYVNIGDVIEFTASGTICSDALCTDFHDPEGCCVEDPDPCANRTIAGSGFLVEGVWKYSLVGKIGKGAGFFVGKNNLITTANSGELYLAFNDEVSFYADNSGSYDIVLQMTSSLPETYEFVTMWGSCGSGDYQFGVDLGPRGLVVDEAGNLYVADYGNRKIKVFSTSGTFKHSFYSSYVSDIDYANGHLYFTKPSGYACKYTVTGTKVWEKYFSAPGWNLNGICVDSDGNIHVCNSYYNKVYKLDPSSGNLIKEYSVPEGSWQIASDNSGHVYIASGSGPVQRFTNDGVYDNSRLNLPPEERAGGIDVDDHGNIFIGTANHKMRKYNSDWSLLAEWGVQGSGEGQFSGVGGVTVDNQGYVYLSDGGGANCAGMNRRIQVFRPAGDWHFAFGVWVQNGDILCQTDYTSSPTGNQTFAWHPRAGTDFDTTISFEIQAINPSINHGAGYDVRIGIVANTEGGIVGDDRKWSCFLTDREYLALLEENVAHRAKVPYIPQVNVRYNMRMQITGNSVRGKVWREGEVEPDWMVSDLFQGPYNRFGVGVYAEGADVCFYPYEEETPVITTILWTSPHNNEVNVHHSSNIIVAFSDPMDELTMKDHINIESQKIGTRPFKVTRMDGEASVYEITDPRGDPLPFWFEDEITVTIDGDATNADGVKIDGNNNGIVEGEGIDDYIWSFSIESQKSDGTTKIWAVLFSPADEFPTGNVSCEYMRNVLSEKYQVPLNSIHMKLDQPGQSDDLTGYDLADEIKWLSRQSDGDDVVILHYVGHGGCVPDIDEGDQTLWGTECGLSIHGGAIRYNALSKYLGFISARDLLLILDTCGSGKGLTVIGEFEPSLPSKMWVLGATEWDEEEPTSCGHNPCSPEIPGWPFSSWLIDGLYGGGLLDYLALLLPGLWPIDSNLDGYISIKEAFYHAKGGTEIVTNGQAHPVMLAPPGDLILPQENLFAVILKATCPVDLWVRDPEGNLVNKATPDTTTFVYEERDLNGDGSNDDRVIMFAATEGEYVVGVIPEPDAIPTDSFTMIVCCRGDRITIADNFKVADIPQEGYRFTTFGRVSVSVSDSSGGVLGVAVDVLDSCGSLVYFAHTAWTGFCEFDSVDPGEYTVSIVTPVGYVADFESRALTVTMNADSVVNFDLRSLRVTPSQRSTGYWKHQVNVHLTGKGNAQESLADMSNFMSLVEEHFNSSLANPITIFEVPQPATQTDSLEALQDLLTVNVDGTMNDRAKQQLIALMLNVVSLKLHQTTPISKDSATVSQAITYCNRLITDSDPTSDEVAKDIADNINNGILVASEVVPLTTPNIMYKGTENQITQTPSLPEDFSLEQNHPNPFNPECEISYALPEDAEVNLCVYNLLGQKVRTLVDAYQAAGHKTVHWDGTDDGSNKVSSGIYFYRITTGDRTEAKKMILMK